MIYRAHIPLRIIPRPAEAAYSVLQRTARRHDCTDVATLQKIIDLRSYNSRNAHVTNETIKQFYEFGILPENDLKNSVIYARDGGTFVGTTCLSKLYAPRRILELGPVCLTCLEEDLRSESEHSGPMTYRRWYWDLNYLDICAHHRHRLLRVCPRCRKRLAWKSLDPRYCSCGADLLEYVTHSKESTASETQQHIAEATLGTQASGCGPLFELAPKEIQDLTVRLALQLKSSKTNTVRDLAPQANDEFQDRAFQALKHWPDGFDELLEAIRTKSASSKLHINEAYGSIYRWLTRRRYKCYEPVARRIAVNYDASLRNQAPRKIFKVVPRTVKQQSVQKLAKELCVPRSFMKYIQQLAAEKRGEAYFERNWITDDEALYAKSIIQNLVDKRFIKEKITRNERNIRNLVSAGFLDIFSTGPGSKPYYFAESANLLADVVSKARAMTKNCSEGVVSLSKSSLVTGMPMTFYLKNIIDNSISIAGHDGGKDGLAGILFDKRYINEVREN